MKELVNLLPPNYPNPVYKHTTFPIIIPDDARVSIDLFDLNGTLITTIFNGELRAGAHKIEWFKGQLSAGVYLYVVQIGDYRETKKIILME